MLLRFAQLWKGSSESGRRKVFIYYVAICKCTYLLLGALNPALLLSGYGEAKACLACVVLENLQILLFFFFFFFIFLFHFSFLFS